MTSHRAGLRFDKAPGGVVSLRQELASADCAEFQWVSVRQCPAPLLREISDFLDSQDTSHPFQFPQWGGSEAQLALLRREGKLRWFAQCGVLYPAGRVVRPIRALTVNRGPVCDDLELMESGLVRLADQSRKMGLAYIDILPECTGSFAASLEAALSRNGWDALPGVRSSLRLDLSPEVDQLLGNFRKVTRYEIRRAERQEVEVGMAREERDFDDFFRLYLGMAREKDFTAEDPDDLRPILRWLAKEEGRGGLLLARKDGKLLGGAMIVRSGSRCWYILGASSKEGTLSPGHLLQWRALQWAKERDCREYDFGGYREGANSGPAFFKRGFCDNVVHFPPPHRYVASQSRLRTSDLISRVRRSLPRIPGW